MARRMDEFTIRAVDGPGERAGEAEAIAERLAAAGDPEGWTAARNAHGLSLEVIKQSTVRTILAGGIDLGNSTVPVHIKLFRPVRLSDRARDALGGSKADRELDNLLAARAEGLPTVTPLLAATWRGSAGSRSLLVTRTEPGALPIGEGPWPGAIARVLGQLLRQVHDRGLHTHDLHPGNALVVPGRLPRAVLVDLGNAHTGERLESKERAKGLAFFCQYLDGGALGRDAAPLVEGYGGLDGKLREECARATRRVRFQMLNAYGRRAFRACRHTTVELGKRSPRWIVHRPGGEPDAPRLEAARAMVEQLPSLTPAKSGRRGAVYLGDGPFAGLVAKTRTAAAARHLWQASYWLQRAGVPAPEPVLLQTWRGQGVVIHRRVGSGPNLQAELASGAVDPQWLVRLAEDLGRTVGRVHGYGLRHRDLKFENLVRDGDRLVPVDLDGVRRKNLLDPRGQAADLGRLLAAFRHADEPGGDAVRRHLLAAYGRTRRQLLLPPRNGWLLSLAERRADEWAARHSRSDG